MLSRSSDLSLYFLIYSIHLMVPDNKILPGNAPGAGASAVIVPPLTFTSDLRNPEV